MEQVQRAALAPGNPSAQDRSVAASAAATAAQARQQLLASKTKETASPSGGFKAGAASVQAGLRFEKIQSENQSQEGQYGQDESPSNALSPSMPSSLDQPMDAYAHHASKHGFWAWGRGFEPIAPEKVTEEVSPRFDFAA
jgi:hypothetical protein